MNIIVALAVLLLAITGGIIYTIIENRRITKQIERINEILKEVSRFC